jgi:hypothetical protein
VSGLKAALNSAVARGALQPIPPPLRVRSFSHFLGISPPSVRRMIAVLNAAHPTHAPSKGVITVTISDGKVVVTGHGFLPNLPGTPNSAVHIRIVDDVDPQNTASTAVPSDSLGSFSHQIPTASFTSLAMDSTGRTRVTFSALDGRIDPHSVPAGEPLVSNSIEVINILSNNPVIEPASG